MIVFDRPDHGVLQAAACPGDFERLLGLRREEFSPIKSVNPQGEGFESYIEYSRNYAAKEYNRAVYKIKPDLSIDWIDAELSVRALLEGGIPGIAEMPEVVEALREIYRARVENTFEKRHPAKTIMKRSAMRRFALTGRMSDHFWGMRPYTPEERAAILKKLLWQMENNPYFNIYFLKDNGELRDAEMTLYDKLGLQLLDANTDYELSEHHSEVLIVHEDIMRVFRNYFERELLVKRVIPYQEAVAFMRELIHIVEEL